jgi:hypothetical protein
MILEFYGAYSAFAGALLLGVLFGVIYDVFRIARVSRMPYLMPKGKLYELIKVPEKKRRGKALPKLLGASDALLTFAEDIVFWLTVSAGEILFIYHVNGGAVRVYFILCTFAGAAVYFFTAGKITMFFSVRIIFLLRCLLYWIFYIIIYPVRLILRLFEKAARLTFIPLFKAVKKRRLVSYSKKRVSRILMQSKKGFYI